MIASEVIKAIQAGMRSGDLPVMFESFDKDFYPVNEDVTDVFVSKDDDGRVVIIIASEA